MMSRVIHNKTHQHPSFPQLMIKYPTFIFHEVSLSSNKSSIKPTTTTKTRYTTIESQGKLKRKVRKKI